LEGVKGIGGIKGIRDIRDIREISGGLETGMGGNVSLWQHWERTVRKIILSFFLLSLSSFPRYSR
jgi:hypothetical protein